jgi:hypothetical protein
MAGTEGEGDAVARLSMDARVGISRLQGLPVHQIAKGTQSVLEDYRRGTTR